MDTKKRKKESVRQQYAHGQMSVTLKSRMSIRSTYCMESAAKSYGAYSGSRPHPNPDPQQTDRRTVLWRNVPVQGRTVGLSRVFLRWLGCSSCNL
jgi:hypothetical protein